MTARLTAVDVLRGCAILLVVQHHLFGGFTRLPTYMAHPWLFAVPANGYYGVNLFFVLSGFVLFLPSVRADRRVLVWNDVARFYRRRAWRLFPLYYASVVVAFLLATGWTWPSGRLWWTLGLVVSFLFQFSRWQFFPSFNPVLWSLAVEVSFSVLVPFLAVLCLRIGIWRVVPAAVASAAAVRALGVALGVSLPMTDGVLGRLDDFVVGMAAAWTYARGTPPRRPFAWLVFAIVTLQLGCMLADVWRVGGQTFARVVCIPVLLDAGMFALLRGALALSWTSRWRPLEAVGRMSYSLYLWHVVIRDQMFAVWGREPLRGARYLLVLFAVSAATYRWIERAGVRMSASRPA